MISKSELKFIRSLKNKKYRIAEKCFLVEGEKNVLELINSGYKVRKVVATSEFLSRNSELIKQFSNEEVSEKELSDISNVKSNDQAIAVVEIKSWQETDLELGQTTFGLDGVRDPGNLGTIIRTLDWFGISQLVCSVDTVELYNPKVISATMGSFTRIKVVYADLAHFMTKFKGQKIGAEMVGVDLNEIDLTEPKMVIMGSESHGIRPEVKSKLDLSVTIPKIGNAESLNVGIATGIICHHLSVK